MLVSGAILFGFYVLLAKFVLVPLFGLGVAVAGSGLLVVGQYVLGTKLALWRVDAEELSRQEYPEVYDRFERLCAERDLPKPDLLVGRMGTPNAFAVGRRGSGVVVVSELLLELLEPDELEAVLAHELAHIDNRDVVMLLLGQTVATLVGLTVFFVVDLLADEVPGGFIVAWVVSMLAQLLVMVFVFTISRYREFVADREAADATDPAAMASALATIEAVGTHEGVADVDDSVAALCIFGGRRGLLAALFSTHPSTEKRIAKLDAMAD